MSACLLFAELFCLACCTLGDPVSLINPNEVTMMEDVLGAYQLKKLKESVIDGTRQITSNLDQLNKTLASREYMKTMKSQLAEQHLVLQESSDNSVKLTKDSQNKMDDMYEGLKTAIKSMSSMFMKTLSDVKQLIQDNFNQLSQFQNQTSKSNSFQLSSDCQDLYDIGFNSSGVYWIPKFGQRFLCDMETDGGGWLVIQRRTKLDEQVDFNRNWYSYKIGFGNLDTEFWIGNDALHILTNQKTYEILFEMNDYEKGPFVARYSSFRVGSEMSNYSLEIGEYSGNSSDAATYHHGMSFTTRDRDNDNYEGGNCAAHFSGGWWYDRCYDAHPNGAFPYPPDRNNSSYITWWSRNEQMEKVPLVINDLTIKIRPV